eukprot:1869298-Rhodomonas_salina.3
MVPVHDPVCKYQTSHRGSSTRNTCARYARSIPGIAKQGRRSIQASTCRMCAPQEALDAEDAVRSYVVSVPGIGRKTIGRCGMSVPDIGRQKIGRCDLSVPGIRR